MKIEFKKIAGKVLALSVLVFFNHPVYCQHINKKTEKGYHLIAHRGGVVDSVTAENSTSALKKAAKQGYWMVEVDLRLTHDSVLITHHDNNFKRYYGVDSAVSAMDWADIKKLEGNLGNKVLSFQEVLQLCQMNGLQVMIDNKIRGNDTVLFTKIIDVLKKYDRFKYALMIGTDESTSFFTGKVKLTCSRQQLEENMLKAGYSSDHYLLFSENISKDDMEWAKKNNILVVGTINAWELKTNDLMGKAGEHADKLKSVGVKYYQVDSIFDVYFK